VNVVFLLALLLHRPVGLVSTIYDVAGIDGVAVVEYESQFCPTAWTREKGGTSWGLWQLYSKCHPQHREDLLMHIVEGASFWAECREGRELAEAYSIFNSGSPTRSLSRGREVERLRDRLARLVAEAEGVKK
jgi:hypothetical protein